MSTLKENSTTRGHKAALVKPYCKLNKRKFSFSQRTINDWNNLSHDCEYASSVNIFKNKIGNYLAREVEQLNVLEISLILIKLFIYIFILINLLL